jgi:hypothetical protein
MSPRRSPVRVTTPGCRTPALARAGTVRVVTLTLLVAGSCAGPPPSTGPLVEATRLPATRATPTVGAPNVATRSPGADATPVSSVALGPTPRLDAEPTRIAIAALGIDLPVVRPRPHETYPLCDVAEFLPSYGLPGLPGVTYLYAHARTGMFLPLLLESRIDDGSALIGKEVELYSSDLFRRRYTITEIHRNVLDLEVVNDLEGDVLVLQTSETSRSSGTKLVVVARPRDEPALTSERAARPTPRPRVCED